ncbi:Listeria-Bacteroides repeat domain [Bacteroidales bacterium Barb6XT]|nr:Listeria-Bacteroides repeat domain [Bacteroidales bacterium Barb6XT]
MRLIRQTYMKRRMVLAGLCLACVFQAMGLEEVVYLGIHYNVDYYYSVASVTLNYEYEGAIVEIPEKIETEKGTFRVSKLEDYAFHGNDYIRYVTIAEGIQEIGEECFWRCGSLRSITLPSSIEYIEPKAFWLNPELADIYLNLNGPCRIKTDLKIFASYEIEHCRLHIPLGTEKFIGWESNVPVFRWNEMIVEPNTYFVKVRTEDPERGKAYINSEEPLVYGEYYRNERTFTAVPNENYSFLRWSTEGSYLPIQKNPYTLDYFPTEEYTVFVACFVGDDCMVRAYSATVGGRVASGMGAHEIGVEAKMTAEADYGYRFVKWVNEKGDSLSADNPYTFTVTSDTIVRAAFAINTYQVSMYTSDNGTIKSRGGQYPYKTKVVLEAESDPGYFFVKWTNAAGDSLSADNPYIYTVTGNEILQAHFAMSHYRVSFSAVNGTIKSMGGIYTYNTEVTAEAKGYYDYHFVNWTNAKGEIFSSDNPCTFAVKSETAIQANFAKNVYQVSVFAADNNGRILSGKDVYVYDTEAEVEAAAYPEYHFARWTNAQGDSLSGDNPYRFVVKGTTTVYAHFAGDMHLVHVSADENGMIKSGGGSCPYGSETRIEATANAGYHFEKWTDAKGDSVSAKNPYTFTVTEDTELQAHFALGGYLVSVMIAENGRIKSGGGLYAYNTEAEIEVVADSGYRFVKWTDAKGGNLSVDNPYRFTVKSDTTIQANFAAGRYAVILSASNNGKIQSDTEGTVYAYDEEITVLAVADSGYHLAKWVNTKGDSLSADNPYTFAVKGDMQVWALFAASRYRVSLFAQNGRIKSGEGEYAYNTEAEASAAADDSCHFVKWINAAGDSISDANPYRFTVKEDVEMTAIFEKEGMEDTGSGSISVGEARAYHAEDVLHLAGLEGFVISVNTIDGRQILQFKADDAEHPAALPAGICILSAANGKERYITKLVVKK